MTVVQRVSMLLLLHSAHPEIGSIGKLSISDAVYQFAIVAKELVLQWVRLQLPTALQGMPLLLLMGAARHYEMSAYNDHGSQRHRQRPESGMTVVHRGVHVQ